ncbi:MAG: LysR substrate-binding domain-containing protein [Comamonadaceae bacterium]|nr:LysR substrate-binding domain-containing protein [Comamonadaceae bacterium]
MRRLCPTISELNAFHFAAKHQSFTAAARELCVTQSAISRHIAALENYLGQPLFFRRSTGLELTEAGATYLSATRPALAALESATSQLMSYVGGGSVLNLSVPPTFATQWLFPRLGHLKRSLPQITLNFVRYAHAHDFSVSEEFDAAIQYGHGSWPGANTQYLIGRETSIVCSPQICQELQLREHRDISKATLLQHIEVPFAWHDWLQAHQCDTAGSRFGLSFNQYSLIIRAAIAGFGLAICPTCVIEDELQSGLLVEPFGARYQSPLGYYLCAPTSRANLPAYKQISAWLAHCCNHHSASQAQPSTSAATEYCEFCTHMP